MLKTTQPANLTPLRRLGNVVLSFSIFVAALALLALSFVGSDPADLPELVVKASLGSGR